MEPGVERRLSTSLISAKACHHINSFFETGSIVLGGARTEPLETSHRHRRISGFFSEASHSATAADWQMSSSNPRSQFSGMMNGVPLILVDISPVTISPSIFFLYLASQIIRVDASAAHTSPLPHTSTSLRQDLPPCRDPTSVKLNRLRWTIRQLWHGSEDSCPCPVSCSCKPIGLINPSRFLTKVVFLECMQRQPTVIHAEPCSYF